MNQEKIGKLIAKMRKEKGLTQQELGDKVGVGYRAVSKWETGLTLPDISIINELSEILGITADELLKGELKEKEIPHKKSKRYLLLLIPIIITISAIIGIYLKINNKEYEYTLNTNDLNFYIEGKAVFKGKILIMNIDKVTSYSNSLNQIIIKNYQYNIILNGKVLFGFGTAPETETFTEPISVREFLNNLKIDYTDDLGKLKNEMINNNLVLELTFIDQENTEIVKNIEIELVPVNEANQPGK